MLVVNVAPVQDAPVAGVVVVNAVLVQGVPVADPNVPNG